MRNKYAPNILDEEEDLNKTKIIQPAPSVRARPSSARPAKRVKQPQSVPMEQPMVVNPNVIRDDDDEDDDLIVEIEPTSDTTDNFPIDSNINGEDHGALVRDILDTKNTIENAATRKEKSYNVVSEADQEKIKKQIDTLKSEIQTITRTTAPIGRVLDFIQEDVDAMQSEYDQWTIELEQNLHLLKVDESKNTNDLKAYYDELASLEQNISQKRVDIIGTKQAILLNQQNIEKQIKMVFSSWKMDCQTKKILFL